MNCIEIYAVARDIDKHIDRIPPSHPSKRHLDAWSAAELNNLDEANSALDHAQAALQSCLEPDGPSHVAGTLAMAAWLVTHGAIARENERADMFLEAAKQSIESITPTRYAW
jgi:ATP/maltotriose-dependent transcriptional regulator MalT